MTDFQPRLNDSLRRQLRELQTAFALEQAEIGPLRAPVSIDFYEKWLARDYHGGMEYLANHLPFKQNPRRLHPELRSVISVAQSYFPAVQEPAFRPPARVALYARNEDYHHWLKHKLQQMIAHLLQQFPGEVFLPYVDSGPLLERDLAYQNGLGWFGKNTCLIHPEHGSLFFIAEILTSLAAPPAEAAGASGLEPLPDFCGKCRRCLEVCPTGALEEPRVMRAELCISYLTIESRDIPPPELRPRMGDWFFGCDLCQTVCPWNEKVFRKKQIPASPLISSAAVSPQSAAERAELVEYFRFLLTASHRQIQRRHFGSPLSRAGAKGLKRNALIVIANRGLQELTGEVLNLTRTGGFEELARWTAGQLAASLPPPQIT